MSKCPKLRPFLRCFILFVFSLSGCKPAKKMDLQAFIKPVESTQTIKLGILHSQTGILGMNEMSLRHSEVLAIEEINESGEFPKVAFVPGVRDGRSRVDLFRRRVRELIDDEQVPVIFGCWGSMHRKAVIDEIENPSEMYIASDRLDLGQIASVKKPLLFYPLQYEGNEASRNVFYFGSTPKIGRAHV